MKRLLILSLLVVGQVAVRGQSIIQIPLNLSGTGVFTWPNAVWWTNNPAPTNIETWQAWWAVNTNFAFVEWAYGELAGQMLTTNQILNLIASNDITANNFTTSAPKWNDMIMNYAATSLGPNAPALTAVSAGSLIQAYAFDNGDILYAQCQFPHTIATTNAAFPNFYFEPHVHFTTIGTLNSTHSNVTWRVEWEFSNIGGTWTKGTNSVTYGVAANDTHHTAELGHITNNALPHLSSIFRCRLTRPASAGQDYSNAHDVILDGFDLHVPVGNQNAIGSSSDNAP